MDGKCYLVKSLRRVHRGNNPFPIFFRSTLINYVTLMNLLLASTSQPKPFKCRFVLRDTKYESLIEQCARAVE